MYETLTEMLEATSWPGELAARYEGAEDAYRQLEMDERWTLMFLLAGVTDEVFDEIMKALAGQFGVEAIRQWQYLVRDGSPGGGQTVDLLSLTCPCRMGRTHKCRHLVAALLRAVARGRLVVPGAPQL